MKVKKGSKKLVLKRSTIASLNGIEMSDVKGGGIGGIDINPTVIGESRIISICTYIPTARASCTWF